MSMVLLLVMTVLGDVMVVVVVALVLLVSFVGLLALPLHVASPSSSGTRAESVVVSTPERRPRSGSARGSASRAAGGAREAAAAAEGGSCVGPESAVVAAPERGRGRGNGNGNSGNGGNGSARGTGRRHRKRARTNFAIPGPGEFSSDSEYDNDKKQEPESENEHDDDMKLDAASVSPEMAQAIQVLQQAKASGNERDIRAAKSAIKKLSKRLPAQLAERELEDADTADRISQEIEENDEKHTPPPVDPIIIALYAEKGGVGKTTLTSTLAYLLASSGNRVLVYDCDSQRSLTAWLFGTRIRAAPFNGDVTAFIKHVDDGEDESPKYVI